MTADEIRERLEAARLKVWESVDPAFRGCPDSPVVGSGTPEQWAALFALAPVVPPPPDAPAELLEAVANLDAAIGRCAEGAKALAGTPPGEELERKQAVYQWLRDIVAAAPERRPSL